MTSEIFLTSSVHAVAHDIAKRISRVGKLVFIDTAAEPKQGDMEWLENDRKALVDAGFEVTNYTITGKTSEEIKHHLVDFDVLYFSGGDTIYTLRESQKSNAISVIRELVLEKGKIYIGTSAGSIMAGPKLPNYLAANYVDLQDAPCYNLVNFTLVPHWGSEHFREKYLNDRLKIAYHEQQVPLLLLTDSQYVQIVDGKCEIIDVA